MIKFKKWGPWTDMSVGKNEEGYFFCLQARRREDGKVQFRVEKNTWTCDAPTIDLNDLKKANIPC